MSKVTLNGYVVPSDQQWVYDYFGVSAFSPATVRDALANTPAGETLEVEINSPGGSMWDGFEIYSMLYAATCDTLAIVQSLSGSAASILAVGCKRVLMTPVGQMMIHLPSLVVSGNQNNMRHAANDLEKFTQSILNGYLVHSGGKADRATLESLMQAETWLTAQEAVELGLADGILGDDESGGQVSAAIVNSVGSGIRALVTNSSSHLPTQELLARYEQLVRNGATPVEGHPVADVVPVEDLDQEPAPSDPSEGPPTSNDWRQKARLDIERNRFTDIK